VDAAGRAILDFSILGCPDGVVYLNGKLYALPSIAENRCSQSLRHNFDPTAAESIAANCGVVTQAKTIRISGQWKPLVPERRACDETQTLELSEHKSFWSDFQTAKIERGPLSW
jgi:hypothetical protein